MHERFSKVLAFQSKQLIRLGIYTAIVLFVFAAFITLWGLELKKTHAPEEAEALSPTAVTEAPSSDTVLTDSTIKETHVTEQSEAKAVPDSSKNRQKTAETKKLPVITPAVKIKDVKWPARGEITGVFGISYSQTFSDYRFHKGVDIELTRGSEVMAVLDGKVYSVETTKGQAGLVLIEHGPGWQSVYAHLNDVYVKPGDKVKQGQALGSVDQPGLYEVLEGPHLHFELLKEGREVNPLDYLPK